MTYKTIKILIATFVLLTIFSFLLFPIDNSMNDIRDQSVLVLFNGGIQTGSIFCTVIMLTVRTIKIENEKKTNGLRTFMMLIFNVFIFIFFIFILLFLEPPFEDSIIYKSTIDPSNHILVQYYETGITGNPHHRLIKTMNIESRVRNISLLPDSLLKTINVGERFSDNPIKVFTYDNESYELEKYYSMDKENISR